MSSNKQTVDDEIGKKIHDLIYPYTMRIESGIEDLTKEDMELDDYNALANSLYFDLQAQLKQLLIKERIDELTKVKAHNLADPWQTRYMDEYLRTRKRDLETQLKGSEDKE